MINSVGDFDVSARTLAGLNGNKPLSSYLEVITPN